MSKYKILIADDHAMVRDGVKNLVKQNKDYVVVGEASNGKEALDQFETLKPDLIILDISMPDMNGMDVSKEILSRDPAANILIMSMYDDDDYISRCLEFSVTPQLDSVLSIRATSTYAKFANCSVTSFRMVAVPVTWFAAFAAW